MFDVKGDKAIIKRLNNLEKQVQNKILRKGVRATAKVIQKQAVANAPVGETGTLKRSIKVRAASKKRGRVAIVVTIRRSDMGAKYYGAYNNWGIRNKDGTWRIEPDLYMDNAADQVGDQAKAVGLQVIVTEIDKL